MTVQKSNVMDNDSVEVDLDSSAGKNSTEDQTFSLESDINMEMLRDSSEESSASEEDSFENHGSELQSVNPDDRTVKLIILGCGDCGKKQLIEGVFCDPQFDTTTKGNTQIDYHISLSRCSVWIFDVDKMEYFKNGTFSDGTVFLFCYDVDKVNIPSLRIVWDPTIFEESVKYVYYLLVGIKDEAKPKPVPKKRRRGTFKTDIEAKMKELNGKFSGGAAIECSIQDKHSLLNVFQSAANFVYPGDFKLSDFKILNAAL